MSYPSNPRPSAQGPPNQGTHPESSPQNPKPTLATPMAIGTELWLVVIAGQAIAYGGQYSAAADSVRRAAREASTEQSDLMASTGLIVGVFVGVGVVVTAVSLLLVWLARSGHNWARLALSFLSGFLVVQAVFSLFGDGGPAWTTIPSVISGVAALGAGYLLLQKDSEKFCRDMAMYRRGGATPTPYPAALYPPNAFPPAQYPPSQYPPSQYPANQYPPAQYPPAQYPPAQHPPAQYPPAPPQYDPNRYQPPAQQNQGSAQHGDQQPGPYYDPHAYDPRTFDPQAYQQAPPTPPADDRSSARPATGENVRERDLSALDERSEDATPDHPDDGESRR
ncbi:hypothetical protein ACQ7HM_02090 [Williamsia sp. MIQD14]|uniref:hypothetical protein n=1 Tax=Williamsia sp. MIQD14 TaxID=3425703 RepID=UPI003DA0A81E